MLMVRPIATRSPTVNAPLPITCTLGASEYPERVAQIRSLGRDSLISAAVHEGDATLRFKPDSPTRDRVTAFVAAESACCAFLEFAITEEADALVLTITA